MSDPVAVLAQLLTNYGLSPRLYDLARVDAEVIVNDPAFKAVFIPVSEVDWFPNNTGPQVPRP